MENYTNITKIEEKLVETLSLVSETKKSTDERTHKLLLDILERLSSVEETLNRVKEAII